jgi:hypothetical protein
VFDLTTNEAGNFFVEGNPEDLAKPFKVLLKWTDANDLPKETPMFQAPSYGGCAKCHTPGLERYPAITTPPTVVPEDEEIAPAGSKIGMPGYLKDLLGPAATP